MYIPTYNKALTELAKKALSFAFVKEVNPNDEESFYCNDSDGVRYRLIAKPKVVSLYLIATDVKNVWDYSNQHFKNKYFKHFNVNFTKFENCDAIEARLNEEALTIWNQTYTPKDQSGITTGKKKFDALFEYLSKKMASIKRHFFASPFEMMLEAVEQNAKNKANKMLPNLSYHVKEGSQEKIWIAFEKNQFSVYYGVSFEDKFEQQLGKILFSELIDAKKHVRNPPGVMILDSDNSKNMVEAFPEQKSKKYTFKNGIIAFSIFGSLVSKPESIATFLCNFRNYVYYHIQAQKCYLHSRVLRRIQIIQKDLNHTKIEPFALN